LPEGVDVGLREEAKVEDVGEKRREKLKKIFDGADWKFDTSLDEVDALVMKRNKFDGREE
jgi:hypothetical protein